MHITDLSLTLFRWPMPIVRFPHITVGGEREIAVVTVRTDEGVEGHVFLGSASRDADVDAPVFCIVSGRSCLARIRLISGGSGAKCGGNATAV